MLLVSCFGAFLAFLDATIVNVAFPSLRDSFPDTSISDLSWVLNAYNIVFAAFLIVCGRLTDLLGRRRAFATGVLVFTLASALCGAAPTVELLVAARVLQALGAALLVPASLALVVEAFPAERRAHAIGLWGAVRGRGGGRRPADRRRSGAARGLALGLPRQPPVRRRRALGGPQPPRREPGARAPRASPTWWAPP